MGYRVDPNAKNVWVRDNADTMDLPVQTDANSVYFNNGRTMEQEFGKGAMVSNVVTIDSGMEKVIDGTYDGAYESLVFKGKSLVNLVTHSKHQNVNVQNLLDSNGRLSWNTTGVWGKVGFTVQGKPNSTYCVKYSDKHTTLGLFVRYMDGLSGTTQPITTLNSTCRKFTTDTTGIFTLTLEQGEATTDSWIQDFMILEYQEGMENWDIPYFEGLCDVKMPILRNVGKNLLDPQTFIPLDKGAEYVRYEDGYVLANFTNANTHFFYKIDLTKLPKGMYTVIAKHEGERSYLGTQYIFKDGTKTWGKTQFNNDGSYTELGLYMQSTTNDPSLKVKAKIMLVANGDTTSPYENHKTNILRTSEEIVLREVGGVQDTYNPLTGEYVKRIGEVVITSAVAKSVIVLDKNVRANITMSALNGDSGTTKANNTLSDKFYWSEANARDIEGLRVNGNTLHWCVSRDKLTSQDLQGVNTWLQSNPITVQYILAEPITTIVELLTIPFAYQNGHVILESGHEGQSLLPTLEYQTVVSRSGQVAMIDKTIQQHERKITLLEKMLVQNIIDIEYKNTLLALKLEINEVI